MASSSYDICVPAFVNRHPASGVADYRGCDPCYRAGSVLAKRNEYGGENWGDFGQTAPITEAEKKSSSPKPPTTRIFSLPNTLSDDPIEVDLPSIDELLKNNSSLIESVIPNSPSDTKSEPVPKQAPFKKSVTPSQTPSDIIPWDAPLQTPPPQMEPDAVPQTTGEPTITLEDLQRLDPSVTDIKILSIEDSVSGDAVSSDAVSTAIPFVSGTK